MSSLDRRALTWLHDHHATISTGALGASSVSLDQRKRLVRAGVLERVVDGAYALAGVDHDELARAAALCSSRPHLIVAGPTAARLWAFRRAPHDGLIHVLAPPRSHPCREPWVRAYRTPLIFDDETVQRPDGIRVSSPPRTVVDLTRYIDAVSLGSTIEHVLARQLCTVVTLHRTALRLATPGRPWVRRFLSVLAQRHPGAAAESEGEMRVFDALVARGVRGLDRQVCRVLPGYGMARFDIAVAELRLGRRGRPPPRPCHVGRHRQRQPPRRWGRRPRLGHAPCRPPGVRAILRRRHRPARRLVRAPPTGGRRPPGRRRLAAAVRGERAGRAHCSPRSRHRANAVSNRRAGRAHRSPRSPA